MRLSLTQHQIVTIAAAWTFASFLMWITACLISPLSESATAGLTALASLAQLLRIGPVILSSNPRPAHLSPTENPERLHILGLASQIQVLGFVAMLSPNMLGALPALLVIATVEWLLPHPRKLAQAPKMPKTNAVSFKQVAAKSSTASQTRQQASNRLASTPLASKSVDCQAVENQTGSAQARTDRTSTEHDVQSESSEWFEEGIRIIGGWTAFSFEPDQKVVSVPITFTSPFSGTPLLELEVEVDDDQSEDLEDAECETSIEALTPIGSRVSVKRKSAKQTLHGKLIWHAQSGNFESNSPTLSSLP